MKILEYNDKKIVLYAQNYDGYKNLLKLCTLNSEKKLELKEIEKSDLKWRRLNFQQLYDANITFVFDEETKSFKIIEYKNVKNHDLLNGIYMDTPFCKFKMTHLSKKSGVYLWVEEGEIIYIGETNNLHRRFNSGYGQISPRNCYVGGQNTNVKMNRIALDHYMQGKTIDIYVCETPYNKFLEMVIPGDILQVIRFFEGFGITREELSQIALKNEWILTGDSFIYADIP